MATEGTVLKTSQVIAAANYGNGANLAGTNTAGTTGGATGSGQFLTVQVTAARTVTVTPTGNAGQVVFGVLQNKPGTGQAAEVVYAGETKFIADSTGSITAGMYLQASSAVAGTVMAWATTKYAIGIAYEAAAAGQVFSGLLFSPQKYT